MAPRVVAGPRSSAQPTAPDQAASWRDADDRQAPRRRRRDGDLRDAPVARRLPAIAPRREACERGPVRRAGCERAQWLRHQRRVIERGEHDQRTGAQPWQRRERRGVGARVRHAVDAGTRGVPRAGHGDGDRAEVDRRAAALPARRAAARWRRAPTQPARPAAATSTIPRATNASGNGGHAGSQPRGGLARVRARSSAAGVERRGGRGGRLRRRRRAAPAPEPAVGWPRARR